LSRSSSSYCKCTQIAGFSYLQLIDDELASCTNSSHYECTTRICGRRSGSMSAPSRRRMQVTSGVKLWTSAGSTNLNHRVGNATVQHLTLHRFKVTLMETLQRWQYHTTAEAVHPSSPVLELEGEGRREPRLAAAHGVVVNIRHHLGPRRLAAAG
jgi:hypothetical protein